MKPTIFLRILHQPISFFIGLSAVSYIVCCLLRKVIFIDEVIACVVRWINVYHLHLAQVGFPQNFQGVQIIPFDVNIFRVYPPDFPSRPTDFSRSSLRVLVVGSLARRMALFLSGQVNR